MPHYFILDSPVASPAKCGLCGYGGAERKYLDPRLDFEFYGSLIFCESCIGTLANDFDYLSPKQSANLIERLDAAEKELMILRAAVIHLENANESLSDYHALVNPSNPVSISDGKPDELAGLTTLTVGAGSISSSLESIRDSEIDELDSLERPDDLLSLTTRTSDGKLVI